MADLLSYALCTVQDVKELLNIPSSDTSKDNLIIRKINQSTLMIENYTSRRFKATDYELEEYDGNNYDALILKQRPINSLTTFQRRDTSLNEDSWTDVESELYFTDDNAGLIELNFTTVGKWNRYRVTYNAGYTTIPADLMEAAAQLSAFLVENGVSGTNVKSKQEGQRKIEYHAPSQTASGNDSLFEQLGIDEILNSYSNMPLLADK